MHFLLLAILFLVASCQTHFGSILFSENKYQFVQGIVPGAAATGIFEDDTTKSGWGKLHIHSNKAYHDLVQMYAAGYLEGILTSNRIAETAQNIYSNFFSKKPPSSSLLAWYRAQDNFVYLQTFGDYGRLTPFWKVAAGLVAQKKGLVDGFKDSNVNRTLPYSTDFSFNLMTSWGDMLDLISAVTEEERPDWDSMTATEARRVLERRGRCSALIKILGDYSEVFFGQSAWFTYGMMNRIYKHYNFELSVPGSQKTSFSSYPGALASQDDFYMMESGLVMLETSNGILNASLYADVTSFALLAWQRVRIANYLATDGKSWCQLVGTFNSGTYNNQYMVVDTKKFQKGQPLQDGFLWVAEQIPGQVESADLTNILRFGYWPSYNIPYFRDIWTKSGYGKYGNALTHELAPRGQIFRRDQGKIVDFESFKAMMRYNDYLNDPIANGDPGNAICSRFDLDPTHPDAAGCYDTKVTSSVRVPHLLSEAINGPTTSHGLPPFVWTSQFDSTVHEGEPKTFNFRFEEMAPHWK